MNSIKKSFILIASIILISASTSIPKSNAESESLNEYSGEEIFIGINFGLGPVGDLFSHEWTEEQLKANQNPKVIKIISETVNKMDEKDSNYFKDLKDSIYGQDYLKVSELLVEGGENFGELVDLKQHGMDPSIQLVAGAFAALYAVAATSVVVVATHGVYTAFYYKNAGAGPGIDSNTGSSLDHDLVVDNIIKTLN